MQRYFISPEQLGGQQAVITGEDAHHLVKVMRMKQGDKIIVCDGTGKEALAQINELKTGLVTADILGMLEATRESAWRITVAQSLPKGDKMETVIQKGTEIGAAAFVPFQSERMIVQYDGKKEAKRLERWAKIAKEAAEQAHRSIVPAVSPVHSWKQLLDHIPAFDLALFCYEKEGGSAGSGLKDVLKRYSEESGNGKAPDVLLIVGPEGGFTEREAEEALGCGALVTGLGKRILRTETAAMIALSCIMYESGEMGGG